MKSPLTTLCYIEHDGCYLMMHRVVKKNDANQDKWIGIGGHFEDGESPEECLIREAKEETGLTLSSFRFRGLVTFVSDRWDTEYMCLYTAKFPDDERCCQDIDHLSADMDNSEGILEWVPKSEITKLNLWEGDKIFLQLLAEETPFFSLKLRYEGEILREAVLDGQKLRLSDACVGQEKLTNKRS